MKHPVEDILTADKARTLFSYNPTTGEITRLTTTGRFRAGDVVNPNPSPGEYRKTCHAGHPVYLHRLAWLLMTGEWPAFDIDHRNLDRQDNRWENLRSATRSQNLMNKALGSANKSGIKGVSFERRRGRWLATIKVGGRNRFLGYHDTKEAAAAARARGAAALHGEFARNA